MKRLIAILLLCFVIIGCGRTPIIETVYVNQTVYQEKIVTVNNTVYKNETVIRYKDVKGDCNETTIISETNENCLYYIKNIQRLERERDNMLGLNDSELNQEYRTNLTRCYNNLEESEDKLEELKEMLE